MVLAFCRKRKTACLFQNVFREYFETKNERQHSDVPNPRFTNQSGCLNTKLTLENIYMVNDGLHENVLTSFNLFNQHKRSGR
jgi:hypothetical protein